jgi:hypothetical protein
MLRKIVGAVLVAGSVVSASADITIQELFDNASLDSTIHGQGANLTSGIGFAPGSTWAVNAGDTILTANNFNVESTPALPGLSPQLAGPGGIWVGGTGGNAWATDIWATRALAASSVVNFGANQTLYFSVRLNNTGDNAVGIGFANGSSPTSGFVGVGAHWDNHTDPLGGSAANSLYLSAGTLNQNLGGNNVGPYAALAHTTAGTLNGRALIVGQLILSASGSDVLNLKQYNPGSSIDTDLGAISWTLSANFNESMTADHLLLWANGQGNGELDAIRVGTSWFDVTGQVPEPTTWALLGLGGLALLLRRRLASK